MACVPGLVFYQLNSLLALMLFRCMFKYGFCICLKTFRELSGNYESILFKVMLNSHFCIHQLLPSVKNDIMQLRPRGHKFILPNCHSNLYKVSFVNRCLFNYVKVSIVFIPFRIFM